MWKTFIPFALAVVVGVNLHQLQHKTGSNVAKVSDAEAAMMYGGCSTAQTVPGRCTGGDKCAATISIFTPCPYCAKLKNVPCVAGMNCGTVDMIGQGVCSPGA